ncbi:MAG: DUF4344 domain-containing metallopeptidase [bacterium]
MLKIRVFKLRCYNNLHGHSLLKIAMLCMSVGFGMFSFKAADAGQFFVEYVKPEKQHNQAAYLLLQQSGFMEKILQFQYPNLTLPKAVLINARECGTVNAFYDGDHHHLTLCYELVNYLMNDKDAQTLSPEEFVKRLTGILMFTLYHEMGHAVIDILDLPVLGREEDAADQFAVLSFIEAKSRSTSENKVLLKDLLSYAIAWFALHEKGQTSFTDQADEHSLNGQRFFNALCLIYAENPAANTRFIRVLGNRVKRCPNELKEAQRAWGRLLSSYQRI